MSGLTKTGNVDTKKDTDATMNKLSQGKVSNEKVMGFQNDMANNQLAKMIPFFESLMNHGQSQFSNNPIFGGQASAPPGFQLPPLQQQPMQSMNNQQQAPAQPPFRSPQSGMGIQPGMTPDEINAMILNSSGMIPPGRR